MFDFGFYARIFLRRLPYVLVLFVLCSAAGITLALMLPPVYRAEATLLVESEQIPDKLAASTVQTEATEQLQIIQQRILTRDILLEMANRLGIYATPKYARMPADKKVDDLRDRIRIVTTGGASQFGRGPAQATIVSVSFEAPTSGMAAAVTNELVTLILKENVKMRTTVAGQTLDFFTREVENLDQQLSQMSTRILAFQQENMNALPDSLEFRRSQQAALQERLTQLERDEAMLKDRRNRMVELYEATGRTSMAPPDPRAMSPEEQRLAELKERYASSVAVLSLENPKVTVLRNRIEALEKTVAAQKAGSTPSDAGTQKPMSDYDIQLADLDGQLEYIRSSKEQIQGQMAELKTSLEATPGNAVTLDALQRDYANIQAQYNQAVANKARAETGDMIESLSKGQRISVIEQAIAPREPTEPNRPKIAAAGVAGGIALGVGFVLLLEVLNTAVRRPADIATHLGITPFGTVPYLRTRQQVRNRRLIISGTLLVLVVGVPAGLWLVDTHVTPLEPLLNRVLDRVNLAGPGLAPVTRA